MKAEFDVIVVGGGPVGLGLARDLGLRGVSTLILEKRQGASRIPKGQSLSQRTMEILSTWGVEESVRAAQVLPPEFPTTMATTYGTLLGRHWAVPPARGVVQDYYAREAARLPQYLMEDVLRTSLRELPTVDFRAPFEVTAVEARDDDVTVTANSSDGHLHHFTASFVVGCDGNHSRVREAAGIERSGTDWGQLVTLILFRSTELNTALKSIDPASTYRVLDPGLRGFWKFFGRVDVDGEFFFHAPVPSGTRERFDPTALLHDAAGFEFACDILNVGFWDLRVQVARDYRAGRVLIAGDAAHAHPPYGGFGVNSGLEDAKNLGWKLAAHLAGWGGDPLLDSYGIEREGVFRDVGENLIGEWIRSDAEFLRDWTPDREGFRERFADVASGWGSQLAKFEPTYDGSPVIAGTPGAQVRARGGAHSLTARVGHHLPPLAGAPRAEVFDRLGPWFTLLVTPGAEEEAATLGRVAEESSVPLRVTLLPAAHSYGSPLVLVRPDHYIAWLGKAAPTDPHALFHVVTGQAYAAQPAPQQASGRG